MRSSLLSFFVLMGCTPVIVLGPVGQNSGSTRDRALPVPGAGIANPASVFCTQNNGRLEIRREALGETGYCIFNDRSWCEEWSFFRGSCKPGERFDL